MDWDEIPPLWHRKKRPPFPNSGVAQLPQKPPYEGNNNYVNTLIYPETLIRKAATGVSGFQNFIKEGKQLC